MSEIDSLMYALRCSKEYEKFYNENEIKINKTLEFLYSITKEGFTSGFEAGRKVGFDSGVINTNVKMLMRLAEETDLSDEDILYVLDKEADSLYIQKLTELRKG